MLIFVSFFKYDKISVILVLLRYYYILFLFWTTFYVYNFCFNVKFRKSFSNCIVFYHFY